METRTTWRGIVFVFLGPSNKVMTAFIRKKTEAQAAFSNAESLTSKNSVAAERAQQDKRTNNVFR